MFLMNILIKDLTGKTGGAYIRDREDNDRLIDALIEALKG